MIIKKIKTLLLICTASSAFSMEQADKEQFTDQNPTVNLTSINIQELDSQPHSQPHIELIEEKQKDIEFKHLTYNPKTGIFEGKIFEELQQAVNLIVKKVEDDIGILSYDERKISKRINKLKNAKQNDAPTSESDPGDSKEPIEARKEIVVLENAAEYLIKDIKSQNRLVKILGDSKRILQDFLLVMMQNNANIIYQNDLVTRMISGQEKTLKGGCIGFYQDCPDYTALVGDRVVSFRALKTELMYLISYFRKYIDLMEENVDNAEQLKEISYEALASFKTPKDVEEPLEHKNDYKKFINKMHKKIEKNQSRRDELIPFAIFYEHLVEVISDFRAELNERDF